MPHIYVYIYIRSLIAHDICCTASNLCAIRRYAAAGLLRHSANCSLFSGLWLRENLSTESK